LRLTNEFAVTNGNWGSNGTDVVDGSGVGSGERDGSLGDSDATKTKTNTSESNTSESNTSESNTTESNTTESNTTASNTTESNTTESNTTESNTTETNMADTDGSGSNSNWGGGSSLRRSSGLIGGDGGTESEAVSDVLDHTLATVSDVQGVGSNNTSPAVAGFASRGSTSGSLFIVGKGVVTVSVLLTGHGGVTSADDGSMRGCNETGVDVGNEAEESKEDLHGFGVVVW